MLCFQWLREFVENLQSIVTCRKITQFDIKLVHGLVHELKKLVHEK